MTILITVWNEESILVQKLRNTLQLIYPQNKFQIIVASDGSTDKTVEIAKQFAVQHDNILVYEQKEQKGKTLTQNAAVKCASGEIIFFTDAGTMLDPQCLKKMVQHFADPTVGCVSAQLVWTNERESGVAQGGGLYWRLEKMLWTYESKLGIMAWAPGGAMAVRASLFRPMDPRYGEDCVVPLDVIAQGYRVVYAPEALAYDTWADTPAAEFKARQRMTLRSFSGTLSKFSAWHPLKRPLLAWSVISHKILRWLTPYFLLVALISNLFLLSRPFYRLTFAAQVFFYLAAFIGYLADRWRLNIPLVSVVYSFCLSNLAMFWGVTKALLGYQIVAYRSEG